MDYNILYYNIYNIIAYVYNFVIHKWINNIKKHLEIYKLRLFNFCQFFIKLLKKLSNIIKL
jgi:hypothetical protein